MLSDKEKKAIEWLKKADWFSARLYAPTILNLIEKQSKEIEELKEERKKYPIAMNDKQYKKVIELAQKEKRENQKKELAILNAKQIEFNKLVNTVNSYKGQFKRQQKELEELKEDSCCMTTCLRRDKEKLFLEDKIKAKIEEVAQWELYNMKIPRLSTLDERLGAKIGIKYVLQSLLEKE